MARHSAPRFTLVCQQRRAAPTPKLNNKGRESKAAKPEGESQMMKAFERWSKSASVSVSSIRPQWKEAQEDYKMLECRADVGGSLSAIGHFLYQIERDPLGVKVDSMELTTRNNDGSQLALVIQVSGLLLNPLQKATR